MSLVIATDMGANLPCSVVEKYNITVLPMLTRKGDEIVPPETDTTVIYQDMRENDTVYTTSCVNTFDAAQKLEPILQAGNDLLYIAFSSGLSSTCQNVALVIDELRAKYPNRKAVLVDSLCAALGQGMLVVLAARKREEGAGLEEIRRFCEETKLRINHWFTVDSLKYLQRGGRVSKAVAIVGSLLDIKPVMRMDDNGKLVSADKARGAKAAIKALQNKIRISYKGGPVFIVEAGYAEAAEKLAEGIRGMLGDIEIIVSPLTAFIGVHSGPGTVGVFCVGDYR